MKKIIRGNILFIKNYYKFIRKNKHFMCIKGRNSKYAKSSNEKIFRSRNYFHTRQQLPSVKMFLQFFLEHKKVFLHIFYPKY
jgi:hypothetical protein